MRLRHASTTAALSSALALGFMTVPAQAASASSALVSSMAAADDAQAVTCGNAYWPHGNYDTGSGKVTVSSAAVRTGPYKDCQQVGSVSQGTTVYYDCYVVNDYGNTWTWIRDGNGGSLGWIYDANLDDNGATVGC